MICHFRMLEQSGSTVLQSYRGLQSGSTVLQTDVQGLGVGTEWFHCVTKPMYKGWGLEPSGSTVLQSQCTRAGGWNKVVPLCYKANVQGLGVGTERFHCVTKL